ncbi:MAG: MFS transporter [Roseibium sp.]|nr:MFS transporter [Roseibium sp.]
MLKILSNRTYRHLFGAQVVALLGTGFATVALALLAYDLAGDNAGTVLGTALAIKIIAYVAVAPIAAAYAARLPRRTVLVAFDVIRAAAALSLPFVSQVWQIYVLIFVLQSASAGFTPTFQATIPDILPDEEDYTRALSLSRLAYDLESLASPIFAAALLSVLPFSDLFIGTALGFLISGLLVVSVALPNPAAKRPEGGISRFTRGSRLYLATPRLRGLLAINLVVAAGGAMVIVNTVVIVQGQFGLADRDTALAFAAFGAGSMIAALVLPSALDRLSDRTIMLSGGALLAAGLFAGPLASSFSVLVALWLALGLGSSAAQVPSGRLIRRSAHSGDRPALFAAQFALSHACWLIAYPLAGWLGAHAGLPSTFLILGAIAVAGLFAAVSIWPRTDKGVLEHDHHDLAENDPHWRDGDRTSGRRHAHMYIIDDLHPEWPREP